MRIGSGDTPPSFGREKKGFRNYLLRSPQPVCFRYEGVPYKITIQDVKLFPQGYSAIALHLELIQDEPSVLLPWTLSKAKALDAIAKELGDSLIASATSS